MKKRNSANCLMIRVWIDETFIKRRISKRLLHFHSDWKADISNLNVSPPSPKAEIQQKLENYKSDRWISLWLQSQHFHLEDPFCCMWLSIEIWYFQVLRSKCQVFAQFWSKSDNSSSGLNLKFPVLLKDSRIDRCCTHLLRTPGPCRKM